MTVSKSYAEVLSSSFGAADHVFTVSQLTSSIKELLETGFPSVWVSGEVSNFKMATSGHCYFSLKDEKSQIKAIIFMMQRRGIKMEIEDGQHLVCHGRVNLYEKSGQYSIIIDQVEIKGVGALQVAFEKLKKKLFEEGLFDESRKKQIPKFPEKIGIVTSPTGAAIRDILNVIKRRFAGVKIIIAPVPVQGDAAAPAIAKAITHLNQKTSCDVLIVGRGGGSLEDLWAFNEEIVARAISQSRIPIISAVGHEVDWTIADFVSDQRAPTPSAAAELVVSDRAAVAETIEHLSKNIQHHMRRRLDDARQSVDLLIQSYAFRSVPAMVEDFKQKINEVTHRSRQLVEAYVQMLQLKVKNQAGQLNALSPLAILSRGYSLTYDDQKQLISDIKKIKKGDQLQTRLSNGIIQSEVQSIEEV